MGSRCGAHFTHSTHTCSHLGWSRALADGRYPVFRQFKAGLGLVPREVWPPGAPNPWRYTKTSREDPDFSMARTLVAAVAVGGLSANCVPFLNMFPSSLVAALAAGSARRRPGRRST